MIPQVSSSPPVQDAVSYAAELKVRAERARREEEESCAENCSRGDESQGSPTPRSVLESDYEESGWENNESVNEFFCDAEGAAVSLYPECYPDGRVLFDSQPEEPEQDAWSRLTT